MSSVVTQPRPLERLKAMLAEIADIEHAEAVLDWDSRVSMPPAGAQARAELAATLTQLAHERFVSDELGELLEQLAPDPDEDSVNAALVRVTHRLFDRARR